MAEPKRMPNIVVANGQRYHATVFLIHTKHKDGAPALCKLLKDDAEIELSGGEEFMICYVSETMLKPDR